MKPFNREQTRTGTATVPWTLTCTIQPETWARTWEMWTETRVWTETGTLTRTWTWTKTLIGIQDETA